MDGEKAVYYEMYKQIGEVRFAAQVRLDAMDKSKVSEAERDAENLRHCYGIWLHALTYDGPGWSFRAPPPPWA